ncbi:MAG: hypothetical protein H6719_15930 [Sandaracinaceae bacterium]|nr:hypothetical protein [Sandaracinaceae bacterium]
MPQPTEHRPHRDAWIPPPPPARLPAQPSTEDDERARRDALEELSELIAELERWRRRQAMRKRLTAARWVFVEGANASVRVRFERGRPVQLRTSAADRAVALSVVAEALDQSLEIAGRWQHDVHALDWHAPVRAID